MTKTEANLEAVMKAIAEISERLDRVETAPKIMFISADEPLVPALRRELIEKTLNTSLPIDERRSAVAKLDAYSRKDQKEAEATKENIAKAMQADYQRNTDQEMFAIAGTKPNVHHVLQEIQRELNFARSKFPGDNVTFAALVEEVGELATAIFSESRVAVRKEAVQVAVMAIRIVLDGDVTFNDWRSKHKLDALTDVPTDRLNLDEMFAESEGRNDRQENGYASGLIKR